MQQHIEIAVRIKPLQHFSKNATYRWDSHSISLNEKNTFKFDYILSPQANQYQVYQTLGLKMIYNALEGYNGCIITYGQTNSGKTYTMTGSQIEDGLIQKCYNTLCNCLKQMEHSEINMSYFQIDNEIVNDLLNQNQNLLVREHAKTGFYIENLSKYRVNGLDDFKTKIQHGLQFKTVKQTKLKQVTSQSHSILELNVVYKSTQSYKKSSVLRNVKITFIDLGGNQKQKKTEFNGQKSKQLSNINKGLSCLLHVINRLADQSQRKTSNQKFKSGHIPYRDSILTKIMKNSLKGQSKIIILCNISLEEKYLEETLSTLRFAQTAKSIQMQVTKNQQKFQRGTERLFEEYSQMKKDYTQIQAKLKQLNRQNQNLQRQNVQLKDQIQILNDQISWLKMNEDCIKIEKQISEDKKSLNLNKKLVFNPDINDRKPISSQKQSKNKPWLSQNQVIDQEDYNNRKYMMDLIDKTQKPSQSLQFWKKVQQLEDQSSQPGDNRFFENNQKYKQNNQEISQNNQELNNFHKSHQKTVLNSQNNSQTQYNKSYTIFTIDEADSKAQLYSSQVDQIKIDNLIIQNQFLRLEKDIMESEIQILTKSKVFNQLKEQQIQKENERFDKLIANCEFNYAQMVFLKICKQKSQKDTQNYQILSEQLKTLKSRYRLNTQKIRILLQSYIQKERGISDGFERRKLQIARQDIIYQESYKKQSFTLKSEAFHQLNSSNQQSNPMKANNKSMTRVMDQLKQSYKKNDNSNTSKSCNKKRDLQVYLSPIKGTTPHLKSILKPQQNAFQLKIPQNQAAKVSLFTIENKSNFSQNTNKFSNHQLAYLKQEYQKMKIELKQRDQKYENLKIEMLEKESFLQDTLNQLNDKMTQVQLLTQDLQTKQYILNIQKQKNINVSSLQNTLKHKQVQIFLLEQQLNNLNKNKEITVNELSLKIKNKQLEIQNVKQSLKDKQKTLQIYQQNLNKILYQMLADKTERQMLIQTNNKLMQKNQELSIKYGVINSQNYVLNDLCNELRKYAPNQNIPQSKKIYDKYFSYFTLNEQSKKSNQSQNSRKPPMTQEQYQQIVQHKTYEYMHKAALFFYKRDQQLMALKQELQSKLTYLKDKVKSKQQEIRQLRENLQKQKQLHYDYKEKYFETKQLSLQIKSQLKELKIKQRNSENYSQGLEEEQVENNFQTKQTVNPIDKRQNYLLKNNISKSISLTNNQKKRNSSAISSFDQTVSKGSIHRTQTNGIRQNQNQRRNNFKQSQNIDTKKNKNQFINKKQIITESQNSSQSSFIPKQNNKVIEFDPRQLFTHPFDLLKEKANQKNQNETNQVNKKSNTSLDLKNPKFKFNKK